MDRFCCGLLLVLHTELICLCFFFLSLVLCVIKHLSFFYEPGMIWFCIISVLLLLSSFVVTQKFHGKFQLFWKGSPQSWSWYSPDTDILNLPVVCSSVVFVLFWWFPMVSVHNICRPSVGQRHSSDALHTNRVVTGCFFMHSKMRTKDRFPLAILCQFSISLRQCNGTRSDFMDNRFFLSVPYSTFYIKISINQPAWYFRTVCQWTQHFILNQLIQKLWMFSVSMSSKYRHTHPIQEKEYLEKLKIELRNSLLVKKNFSLSSFSPPLDFTSLLYSVQQFFWDLLLSREGFKYLKGKIIGTCIVTNSYGIFGLCFIVVGIRHILSLSIFFHYFYCLAGISNLRKARVS